MALGVCLAAFAGWRLYVRLHAYTACVFTDPACVSSPGSRVDWAATTWTWSIVLAGLLITFGMVDLVLAAYFGRRSVHEHSR
jgi:hypothetical protein